MARIKPLLQDVLSAMEVENTGMATAQEGRMAKSIAYSLDVEANEGTLPVIMKVDQLKPEKDEIWPEYKERVAEALAGPNGVLTAESGKLLFLANAISARMEPSQIRALTDTDLVSSVELDRLVNLTLMDEAGEDVELDQFRQNYGDLRGDGVRVAVLDSGIDKLHPHLDVADSVSTCDESDDIPGEHGTHCAGSVASRDSVFCGIAPNVDLLNIKVLRANGSGSSTFITQGIDEALDREADILSMSLGFNHLPPWSRGGHGWSCSDGDCELCAAVDNAVFFGKTVVVAAGNEHNRAQTLRSLGRSGSFDTELGCPGHARDVITVGALTKGKFLPADFSSHGPTAYGLSKPDIAAPGVNIHSTVPVPRGFNGTPINSPPRSQLFAPLSGTSMATPIVAGAAALIMEERRARGFPTEPADIRDELLNRAVTGTVDPATIVGAGRLDLSNY